MKKTVPWAGGLHPEGLRPGHGSRCRESNSVRTVGGPCEPALDLERAAEGGRGLTSPRSTSIQCTALVHLGKENREPLAAAGVMYFFKKF